MTEGRAGRRTGRAALWLASLSLLTVLCFHYPELLTTPDLRAHYPMDVVIALLRTALSLAIVLGATSILLGGPARNPLLALALGLSAVWLGGYAVEARSPGPSHYYLGLDWFVLDVLILAVIFIPLERLAPHDPEQPLLRPGYRTDLVYFFVNHLLIQMTVWATLAPAMWLFGFSADSALRAAVAAQPVWLQCAEILLVADLAQYAIHRLAHAWPWLWRFHAVHHSSETLDWLAGSRLHLVDIVVTRAVSFIPLFALGFAESALRIYVVFVAFHAVLNHANVRFDSRWLGQVLVLPRFHHWHHADPRDAPDKNFAAHLPWIDRLFGTHHLPPDEWPARYGDPLSPQPRGWPAQFLAAFRGPRGEGA